MRPWVIASILLVAVSLAGIWLFSVSTGTEHAESGEEATSSLVTDNEALSARTPPDTADETSRARSDPGSAESSLSFDTIGLPDLSGFDLAPDVESELKAWIEAGCINPDSVRVDGLEQSIRHQADEWLVEEGDVGGLEYDAVAAIPESFGDYGSYSVETLEQLADGSNDAKAALVLALRHHRQNRLPEARGRYEQAIVLGYTRPLRIMPLLRFRLMTEYSDQEPGDSAAQWEYEIERLANGVVRERRGAPFALVQRLMLYIRAHAQGLPSGRSWEETWREARARAEDRYEMYERRRSSIGLGSFDNSRPPIANRLERYAQLYVIGHATDLNLCDD